MSQTIYSCLSMSETPEPSCQEREERSLSVHMTTNLNSSGRCRGSSSTVVNCIECATTRRRWRQKYTMLPPIMTLPRSTGYLKNQMKGFSVLGELNLEDSQYCSGLI